MTTEKFCVKCGKKFVATGREVICPACKAAAQEETKRAAVLRAKKASWTGESVPVRISGRASTVIRKYGAAHDVPFAAALDELLKASPFFQNTGKAWEDITPYKSRRRDKSTTENTTENTTEDTTETASKPQDTPQDAPQGKPQTAQAAKAAKVAKAVKKVASTSKGGK